MNKFACLFVEFHPYWTIGSNSVSKMYFTSSKSRMHFVCQYHMDFMSKHRMRFGWASKTIKLNMSSSERLWTLTVISVANDISITNNPVEMSILFDFEIGMCVICCIWWCSCCSSIFHFQSYPIAIHTYVLSMLFLNLKYAFPLFIRRCCRLTMYPSAI